MPPEDIQQQQPIVDDVNGAGSPEGTGSGTDEGQTGYQRVTPDEAATLPYAELKRRMREEARLHEDGLLPASASTELEQEAGDEEAPSDAGRDDKASSASGEPQAGGNGQQDSELQRLLREAQQRAETLERESAEAKAQREREALEAQHRRVEEAIARLPETQQQLARQEYMQRLGAQALNEYTQVLQQREHAIRQAEIATARTQIPNLLGELAESVAQRHGVKPDRLREYVTSDQFKELLQASQTEEALTAAAANAGQWMEFLAQQEANRLATEREQRRQRAAANPKVQRDTPSGGAPVAGGELDIVRRINSMTREEFFAWKKQQLREARA